MSTAEHDPNALAGGISVVLNRASLGLARFSDYEQAVADCNALLRLASRANDLELALREIEAACGYPVMVRQIVRSALAKDAA